MTPNAARFLAKRPTLIGRVGGQAFYEHPTRGDESPMVCVTSSGRLLRTEWYDLPAEGEVEDWLWAKRKEEDGDRPA